MSNKHAKAIDNMGQQPEKDKSKPTVKDVITPESRILELEKQVANLTSLMERVATDAGQANTLKEYGLKRWIPGKKHMSRWTS